MSRLGSNLAVLLCCLSLKAAWAQDRELIPSKAMVESASMITEGAMRAHIRFLASDLLEGRGPGTRGDELAQLYIATQLQSYGVKPMGVNGGWIQPVPLVGTTSKAPEVLSIQSGDKKLDLKYFNEYIAVTGKPVPSVSLADREIVFVGYGIQAPEYDWDDFKDVNLEGKILLMMNNDPSSDPNLFAGKKRLYYGRWDYKYESAARQKAAGAIIIHTTESAGYPFQVIQTSWTGEEFELREGSGSRLDMRGWVSNEAAKRIAENAGLDLDKLRAMAESRDFKPVSLNSKVSIDLAAAVRNIDSGNVLGVLEGSDPKLKDEYVVFMAHHDHLGLAASRDEKGDMIYNGAIDNASGVATMLTIAQTIARLREKPKRSIIFASVAAEESGLLGSKFLAEQPPVPAGKIAAVINMDGINFLGRSKDVNVIGDGKSDLDGWVKQVAKWQNRIVTPDNFPDKGYYYRSDQFSLAKVGIPGVYLHAGINIIGKPDGWGKQQNEEWTERDYHQPSDEYSEDWELSGAIEDAQLLYMVGLMVGNQPNMPKWNPGDEFEAARLKAIEAASGKN
jgi:Zn-dependent M28 family amino/carboxypeptidase